MPFPAEITQTFAALFHDSVLPPGQPAKQMGIETFQSQRAIAAVSRGHESGIAASGQTSNSALGG